MSLHQVWTLAEVRVSAQCFHQTWGVEQASPYLPALTQRPVAVSLRFLKQSPHSQTLPKRKCWCQTQTVFLLCRSSSSCLSTSAVQSCSWQHLEKGLLQLLASGRVVPERWCRIIMLRVSFLCFDKGGS